MGAMTAAAKRPVVALRRTYYGPHSSLPSFVARRRCTGGFAAVEIGNMIGQCNIAHALFVAVSVLLSAHGFIGGIATASGDEPARRGQDALALPVISGSPNPLARPRDQLWLVNCRSVSYGRHDDDLDELSYLVYQPLGGWTVASAAAFGDTDATTNTCILVLGNGYTAAETRRLGQTAYQRLVTGLPAECGVRFIIWSWPSDHTDNGAVKDLRIKTARTPHVAICLANWLDAMRPAGQVSLLGTSFGGRIVMEALELRGGGRLGNLRLEAPRDVERPRVHVVLISAAVDNDWLMPGRRLGDALLQTDQLLLVNNSSDPILRRYHWLYGARSRTSALGSTGLGMGGGPGVRLTQIDAAPIIGRHHGCAPYFDSPGLVAAMRAQLFDLHVEAPQMPSPGLEIPLAKSPPGSAAGKL
jgi:hypothetical protein